MQDIARQPTCCAVTSREVGAWLMSNRKSARRCILGETNLDKKHEKSQFGAHKQTFMLIPEDGAE
uniref:Uncharacterized protein n=1 Tax=Oryza nivara TaxID=4536 RepID=A0A0E0G4P7_ORYNI